MDTPVKAPIVFLDRDGTINVDHGYIKDSSKIELIPGSANAIAVLNHAGYVVVIVSNQSVIGRGMATHADVQECNAQLERALYTENSSALIDMIVYNPDAPEEATEMRKPNIGMLTEVRRRWELDPEMCWVVGDKISDIEFGLKAGISQSHCILVKTGEGDKSFAKLSPDKQQVTPIATNLYDAVQMILQRQ